jgi:hypothetical protein
MTRLPCCNRGKSLHLRPFAFLSVAPPARRANGDFRCCHCRITLVHAEAWCREGCAEALAMCIRFETMIGGVVLAIAVLVLQLSA